MVASNFLHLLDLFVSYGYFRELGGMIHLGVFDSESTGISPAIKRLTYINNYPTRCSTKQSICYSSRSLYMFRVSTTPIIRNTQNCNHSLRYCTATSLQRGQVSNLKTLDGGSCTKNVTSTGGCSYGFVYSL